MDFDQIIQEWLTSLIVFIPKLIAGIVIFITSLIGSTFVAKWIRRLVKERISNHEILQLVFLITRWSILILGTIMALDQVDFDVTGFIAGLGVAGFTIGFALQDMAKNFISGLLLLYRQPFNIGDTVELSSFRGKVIEINVRDTVIETLDGESVIIPNRDVFENPIMNFTNAPLRRRSVMIGLGYEENADRAIEIFLETIKAVPGVEVDPGPTVRAEKMGDSTLILSALFWIDQEKNDLLGIHSDVIKAIKVAAEDNKINLPYPAQTVILHNQNG